MSDFILGILETGLVDDELKHQYSSYPQMFCDLFQDCDNVPEYKFYNVIAGQYPKDINDCDAYLITGSKHDSFADDPWISTLRDYIRTLYIEKKKMVGICFGHQIIAHALGGKAERCDNGWGVGVYYNKIAAEASMPWFNGLKGFNLNVIHRDQVTELPPNATLLASNEFCPNSAFYIDDIALCFQGHPEFSTRYTQALMDKRADSIPTEVFNKGMDSFKTPTDHLDVAQSIIHFIRS